MLTFLFCAVVGAFLLLAFAGWVVGDFEDDEAT